MKYVQSFVPYFHNKPTAIIEPLAENEKSPPYLLGQKSFAKLCEASYFFQMKSSFIAVDIKEECEKFSEDNFLEIIVPVLNLNNVGGYTAGLLPTVLHPALMVVNGFGAKEELQERNFPYVDFIRVLDLADNHFEVVVTPEGTIEFPKDGFGLYTVIKEVAYILGHRQVISGQGLTDFEYVGAERGKLYLQPPMGIVEPFLFYVCVTQLNSNHQRIVHSIRPVAVDFTASTKEEALSLVETKTKLIKVLYTEFEFMRDFLQKKILDFPTERGYNNFLLRPETFSKLYEGLVHDLVYGYVDKELILNKLGPQKQKVLAALEKRDVSGNRCR